MPTHRLLTMKTNLPLLALILTPALLSAQAPGQPVPPPRPAIGAGGGVGIPGGGGVVPPGAPGVPGAVPGLPGGGGAPIDPSTGLPLGGGPPMFGGGMPANGLPMAGGGMGGMGMGFPMEDRYQLMSLQYLPVGKDQPVPLIIKFDKITGQAWTLQPSPGGKGFQFTAVRQPGAPIPGIVGGIPGGGVAPGGGVVPGGVPGIPGGGFVPGPGTTPPGAAPQPPRPAPRFK